MKKLLTLTLLVAVCRSSSAQSSSAACTPELLENTKGRWVKYNEQVTVGTKAQQQQGLIRLDSIRQTFLSMYSEPAGVDIRWSRAFGIGYFGCKVKAVPTQGGDVQFESVNLLPVASFYLFVNFSPHFCQHTDKGIVFAPGNQNESSAGVSITANDLQALVGDQRDDKWTINGHPVKLLTPIATEKWHGYVVYKPQSASTDRVVLIHRGGALPYKPVSRRVYLNACVKYYTEMYDDLMKKFDEFPANTPSDKQIRDEQIGKLRAKRQQEVKKFTDEIEKTTREGLLDSVAMIRMKYHSEPISESDPEYACMVVTENPDYIRKNVPNYVPQFFTVAWHWSDYPPHRRFEKDFIDNYPVQKLKAMLDK